MQHSKWQRALIFLSMILAGEASFTLPYHVTRFFRPTFLEVFDLSATELGVAQSAYGFIAMAAYFFGGPLADRFAPRKLLAGSLWAAALGGLYLATFPDVTGCNADLGILWSDQHPAVLGSTDQSDARLGRRAAAGPRLRIARRW